MDVPQGRLTERSDKAYFNYKAAVDIAMMNLGNQIDQLTDALFNILGPESPTTNDTSAKPMDPDVSGEASWLRELAHSLQRRTASIADLEQRVFN